MKKLWLIPVLLIIVLFGCQDDNNGALDTTKLKKVKPQGNATEEQLKIIPVSYEAPSLDEGLDALPFKLEIPKKLPFEAKPLQISMIEDIKHDGKNLRVSLSTAANDKSDAIYLMITVHNFKVEYDGSEKDQELSKGVVGSFSGNSLTFEKDGVYYFIGYNNKNITAEKHQEHLVKIANQML
jgi:hypothetical protein